VSRVTRARPKTLTAPHQENAEGLTSFSDGVLAFPVVERKAPDADAPLILVIDDTEDNREVYVQFFQYQGWRVSAAADGVEGLRLASEEKPAVIVLDLGLPKMDGWEVAERLKADAATKHIPIIACTGHAVPELKKRALAAGVAEYIVKPVLPTDLVALIRKHLG
jgi:two-component system cell cycle response regulator DivK